MLPEVRRQPCNLMEYWTDHQICFELEGSRRGKEGILEPGRPVRVEAECGCGHIWRLRCVQQITDLDLR